MSRRCSGFGARRGACEQRLGCTACAQDGLSDARSWSFSSAMGIAGSTRRHLGNPRWRQAPDYLLDSVISLIGHQPAQIRERQQHNYAEARARVARALPFWYRPLIPWLIRMATGERNTREGARSALVAYAGVFRRALPRAERAPRGIRAIGFPVGDVFHLTSVELSRWLRRLSAAAAMNRAACDVDSSRSSPRSRIRKW